MITPMDALFNYAQERRDLTHWLHDEDIAKDYDACLEYSVKEQETLLKTLDGEVRVLFERYVENSKVRHELEEQMMFCQGLATGLQIGVRSCF